MSEENGIGVRALKWLQREQKRAQHAMLTAGLKKASEQDIANIQSRLDVLDYLVGLAIKEDDNENA